MLMCILAGVSVADFSWSYKQTFACSKSAIQTLEKGLKCVRN